jgi:Tfp pilus assembly protein PilO
MDAMKQEINVSELLTKHKDYVIIAAVIVISIMAAKYIYGKQMKEYDRLKGDIDIEQQKSEAIERIVTISNKIKDMKKLGWDTTEFDAISSRIGEIARKRGIKIQNVDPADKIVDPNYIRIPFKIRAEGRTEDVTRFIKDIEALPMLTRVQRISLEPVHSSDGMTSASGTGNVLNVDMTVMAYYFK